MYISGNDLKIYNLILAVFSSIDDSFSCVGPTGPAEYLGTVGICPRFLLANILTLFQ